MIVAAAVAWVGLAVVAGVAALVVVDELLHTDR